MSIELNNINTNTGIAETATSVRQQTTDEKPTETTAGTQTRPADQVSLTPTAQQLRGLEQQIADQPIVDGPKVSAIRETLASGSYEIDPQRVAGKMLDLEKALGDLS